MNKKYWFYHIPNAGLVSVSQNISDKQIGTYMNNKWKCFAHFEHPVVQMPLFVQILIVQKTLFDWTTQISLNPKGGRKDRQ